MTFNVWPLMLVNVCFCSGAVLCALLGWWVAVWLCIGVALVFATLALLAALYPLVVKK